MPKLIFLLAAVALGSAAVASAQRQQAVDWDHAVQFREQLEASPVEQRTREQYEKVLDAFRAIYHQSPTASKAPPAVAAVADLLAEKGRVLGDQRAMRAAIGQYEFLRQQYPGSPQVDNALLLEAEICRQDLKDTACAVEKLQDVVESQPGTSFAEQATLELNEMAAASVPTPKAERKDAQKRVPQPAQSGRDSELASASPAPVLPRPASLPQSPEALGSQPGRVVAITGMRHWSNPTSTRIAIDLGGKVEYEAARVPNPDRIFFDLHGARLAPGLNGHQVEVIDDGYLKRIRAAQFRPDVTRVVLDVTEVSEYSAFLLPNPWRLIIDIHSDKSAGKTVGGRQASQGSGQSAGAQAAASQPSGRHSANPASGPSSGADSTVADVARLSSEPERVRATSGPTSEPVSARVAPSSPNPNAGLAAQDVEAAPSSNNAAGKSRSRGKGRNRPVPSTDVAEEAAIPHAADPDSDGQRSLVRALGLKVGRIVIDAGHGGHDSGTLGPGGIEEKDVVLDVALHVGKLLHQRLGAEIVYTRDDDTFIPLETRTAIANKAQADLFLSIHGNSSPDPSARGVEVYYLNFTSDPNALEVAARENAVSTQSVHQLSDLVRKIALKDKIDESREFAADVDAGLFAGLKAGNPGLRDRGVKKAPFVVLIGAQMPSILAEISFLTNPDDADELRQGAYRERIAESLDAGVERYLRGLSGTGPTDRARSSEKNPATGDAQPAGQ